MNPQPVSDTPSPFLLRPNDEFDRLYFAKIIDCKVEFKEYIEKNGFNLFNGWGIKRNFFFDFIKKNSVNYMEMIRSVECENRRLISEGKDMDDNLDEYGNQIHAKNQKYYYYT